MVGDKNFQTSIYSGKKPVPFNIVQQSFVFLTTHSSPQKKFLDLPLFLPAIQRPKMTVTNTIQIVPRQGPATPCQRTLAKAFLSDETDLAKNMIWIAFFL